MKEVLMIGAGTMGSGIGMVFAAHDYHVTFVDRTEEIARRAEERNHKIISDLIETNYLSQDWLEKWHQNVSYAGEESLEQLVPQFRLIVEGVFENPEVKSALYQKIDPYLAPDCIVCSNTSALNIFELAQLSHPENLLITHWFNPPFIMELVEVVAGPDTSADVISKVKSVLKELGKKPSVINQYVPGFIVNRLGAALMREASYMVHEGWTTPADIDSALALTCGIRYSFEGPMALYDVVGWDIIQAGALAIYPTLCNDFEGGNGLARYLMEEGHLGVAAGKGVFDYPDTSLGEYMSKRTENIIKMQTFINADIN